MDGESGPDFTTEPGRHTPYPTVKSEPESPGLSGSVELSSLEEWIDESVHDLVKNIKDRVQGTISQKLEHAWGDA